MKIFSIILTLFCIKSFAQKPFDCFAQAKLYHDIKLQSLPHRSYSVGDSINVDFIDLLDSTAKKVIGCKFPSFTLSPINSDSISLDHIKADFTLINLNHLSDNLALRQLNDLDSIAKEFNNRVQVFCLFRENKNDVERLTEKLKYLKFMPEAQGYIQQFDLGLGSPIIYLLDRNKIVLHILAGENHELLHTYKELKQFIH